MNQDKTTRVLAYISFAVTLVMLIIVVTTKLDTGKVESQVEAQQVANQLQAQANAQSSAQFKVFIDDLTGAINFICEVTTARAEESGITPPGPNVCKVPTP